MISALNPSSRFRPLRRLALRLALLAALLPSLMLLLPVVQATPAGMERNCLMAAPGHAAHHPDSAGLQDCHCVLCLVQALDVGLPGSLAVFPLPAPRQGFFQAGVSPSLFPALRLSAQPRAPPLHA